MLDQPDRSTHGAPGLPSLKRIGSYLVEAGLLTLDQINVALNDQRATGLRFGEILVARGWLKEQTIEWIVAKVIEPERRNQQQRSAQSSLSARQQSHGLQNAAATSTKASVDPHDPELMRGLTRVKPMSKTRPASQTPTSQARPVSQTMKVQQPYSFYEAAMERRPPISKPLPSVNSSDEDVSWVG